MSAAILYGLCSTMLVGLGLYGLIVHSELLRKILAFNLIGGGVFLLLGVVARTARQSDLAVIRYRKHWSSPVWSSPLHRRR